MSGGELRVDSYASIQALAPLAPAIDALNLESRAPRPSGCFAFTRCCAQLAPRDPARAFELVYLAVREGERLVGCLALRRRREHFAGLSYGCLESLVHPYEVGRLVARPQDEARCAAAVLRHLNECERGWSVVSLPRQDEHSPLSWPPGLKRGLLVRRQAAMQRAQLPLAFESLAEYARSMPGSWRSSVGRNVRKLFGAGEVEWLRCTSAARPDVLLDLYLDLERRSWKAHARPPVDADSQPGLVDFYRALLAAVPGSALVPVFSFVLLDGRVAAGLLAVAYAGMSFWRELAYAEDAARLGPGTLSVLLGIGDAIEQGCHAIDFGAALDYKARWGAVFRPSYDLRLLRAGSLPFFRALGGMVQRRIAAKRAAGPAPATGAARAATPTGAPALAPVSLGDTLTAALAASGARVERVAAAALRHRLPFSTS